MNVIEKVENILDNIDISVQINILHEEFELQLADMLLKARELYVRNGHIALGYESWDEYVDAKMPFDILNEAMKGVQYE